ncbi:MAG: chemotaxis protein CheD [Pseudomonadota bacterium]
MEFTVGIGQITVSGNPGLLKSLGIGSCVAIALYDRKAGIGALAHIMLPCIKEAYNKSQPARFADVAVGMMIEEMESRGARVRNVSAKIFGGANMFPRIIPEGSPMNVGKRNVQAVRDELKRNGIRIIAEETGGSVGRSIAFDVSDGSVTVGTAMLEKKKYLEPFGKTMSDE